ncbi:polysaccharide biosynthesis C-terminal domain-containing protein, partial [Pelotomaculum propionicicum]|uniref:polysaccharide biosynthesis C-terminal domain-containing protein n=1 Tax=Pelotomaculum propionicicum TaxID=258475 RepID=UPI003B76CF73
KEAFIKVLHLTLFLSLPISGIILVLGSNIVHIFFGDNWNPMVPSLMILSIYGISRSVNAIFGSFFQGIGRPEIITYGSILQILLVIVIIYPLSIKYGIFGTSMAVTIPNLLVFLYLVYKIKSIFGFSFSFTRNILSPLLGTIIICIFLNTLESIVLINIFTLIILIFLGMVFYLLLSYKIDSLINKDVFYNFKTIYKGVSNDE